MKATRFFFAISIGHLMLASNVCSASPSAEELERNMIKYRLENIRRGYVRIFVVDDPSPHPYESKYETTFDETQIRQIRRLRSLGHDQWGDPEKIIVTQKSYMHSIEYGMDPPVAEIKPITKTEYVSIREAARILNIQALGIDINGISMLHTAHVETLLNLVDRSNVTVQEDRRGELETWRINYEMKRPNQKELAHVSLWIAPSQGYSVVSMKLRAKQGGKIETCVLDSQLKQYQAGDVWFPVKVTKTLDLDGRVLDRQVIAVEEAHFGGQIDDATFTPAGLELKPGRKVVDSTSGMRWLKVWDGKGLADPSSVPEAPAKPNRDQLLLWPIAIALALLAFFYFRRAIQRRKSTAGA